VTSVSNPFAREIIPELTTVKERDAVLSLCAVSLEKIPSEQMVAEVLGGSNLKLEQRVSAFFAGHPTRLSLQEGIRALERIPVVRLTIAFTPSDQAVVRWQKLCSDGLGISCVLEIMREQDIAAGARIDINGRLFRFVLGDEIEK